MLGVQDDETEQNGKVKEREGDEADAGLSGEIRDKKYQWLGHRFPNLRD